MPTIRSLVACVPLLALAMTAHARSPADAPRLPTPRGSVITVASVAELEQAIEQLGSNTTIVLRAGTYHLEKPIHITGSRKRNITIRGESDRISDVIVRGAGMNNTAVHHGVLAQNVDGLTIANLTIGWVGYHPIAVAPSCSHVHIHHCRLVDAGEQFIKASSDGHGGGVDGGLVEYTVMEYTDMGPANGYTNGVDVHGGADWVVRHNLFRNIRTPAGAKYKAVPAVLMWNGARNTLCEANTFINCDRAIALGLVKRDGYLDHTGGIVRNNFIYAERREVPHLDTGIFVASPNTKVLHNTVVLNGGYPHAVETRWPTTTGVEVVNNLVDGRIVARDRASMNERGNVQMAAAGFFEDLRSGDLHLLKEVARVMPHPDVISDWDGNRRRLPGVSVGADEFLK